MQKTFCDTFPSPLKFLAEIDCLKNCSYEIIQTETFESKKRLEAEYWVKFWNSDTVDSQMDKYYTKTIRFSNATQCPFFKLASLATFVAILAKFDLLLEPTFINIESKQDL